MILDSHVCFKDPCPHSASAWQPHLTPALHQEIPSSTLQRKGGFTE